MSYNLLSEPIRRFIRHKGWEQLRPIQTAAIARVLASDNNYILSSRTASGKTEAAFLPILSKVDFNDSGVQVLYVSPLVALINDQFYRIEELCKDLEVPVTKWHGEANRTLKKQLIKEPSGIVLITPESLEAMFVNKPFDVKRLFSNLKYVVIDEIHSFIGTARGIQLQSILSRLQKLNAKPFSFIGLSATMSEENKFIEVKEFTGEVEKTKILIDRTVKDINVIFRFFKNKKEELPLELLKDLYIETKNSKALIFPNSRGRVEEIAVKLKKISDRVNGHSNYFSHHSSIDRKVREHIESFAKSNNRQNFCISCTSTLELGIDIGSIDEVVQIDATHSIASLIQRVGRSGRNDGDSSKLFLYATNEWSLLQAVACWLLYKEGFIEPPQMSEKPYDIFVHQALSIVKENSGLRLDKLIVELKENAAFKNIEIAEIEIILNHLIEIDLLEKLQEEVLIGIEGEYVVNSRDFYSVFKTEENFKVINAGNTIGQIPFSPQVIEDQNILLSAKVWKIVFIDYKAKKIEVIPANDGKKPVFFGGSADLNYRIREKMLEILYSKETYPFLDQPSSDEIKSLRKHFSIFNILKLETDRPLLVAENKIQFFSFSGTRINRTILLLLKLAGVKTNMDNANSSFEIEISKDEFLSIWKTLVNPIKEIDRHILNEIQENPALMDFSKWGTFLPDNFKIKLLKDKFYDIENTEEFLNTVRLVGNQ